MGAPNTPPPPGQPPYGGGPYGYDPRDPWRWQREQQKAAAAAQRDAWRIQRDAARQAWRAQRFAARANAAPSFVGPLFLIGIGVVALLLITGHVPAWQFWSWYGHWWPTLLIAAGLVLLAEWALDLRRGPQAPARRRSGFIGPMILVAAIGIVAAIATHTHDWTRQNFEGLNITDSDADDFFGSFGVPEHTHDDSTDLGSIPANASIEIQNPRGDVSISAIEGTALKVQSHEIIRSSDEHPAGFTGLKPEVTVSGNAVLIKINGSEGRANLTLSVPKTATVNIDAARGDVTAAGLAGNVTVDAGRGDVRLDSITGQIVTRMSKGDFSAHDVTGDVSVSGHANDATISAIRGKVQLDGDFFGDIHVENATGEVRFHSSRSDIDIPRLPGDMTLNSDTLNITQAAGQVRVKTSSRDIELSQIFGGVDITDSHATVSVELADSAPTVINNHEGNIEITLPPNANFNVNASTRNGDIVSDFPVPQTANGETKSIATALGKGGPRLDLSTQNGDLNLKRGTTIAPLPPSAPAVPNTPAAPGNIRHLKAPKGVSTQAVTQ